MKTVNAYCVSDGSHGGIYMWTCSCLERIAIRRFVQKFNDGLISWDVAKAQGFKTVQVEIRELPDD
jgi:hypothetical protein